MDNVFEIGENHVTAVAKKEWSKPTFEIISKDIIKGGAVSGAEGHAYHLGTYYSTHSV